MHQNTPCSDGNSSIYEAEDRASYPSVWDTPSYSTLILVPSALEYVPLHQHAHSAYNQVNIRTTWPTYQQIFAREKTDSPCCGYSMGVFYMKLYTLHGMVTCFDSRLLIERLQVRHLALPLSSNHNGQVVHTRVHTSDIRLYTALYGIQHCQKLNCLQII